MRRDYLTQNRQGTKNYSTIDIYPQNDDELNLALGLAAKNKKLNEQHEQTNTQIRKGFNCMYWTIVIGVPTIIIGVTVWCLIKYVL